MVEIRAFRGFLKDCHPGSLIHFSKAGFKQGKKEKKTRVLLKVVPCEV